eukprot:6487580-Amphidinium_carterae.1
MQGVMTSWESSWGTWAIMQLTMPKSGKLPWSGLQELGSKAYENAERAAIATQLMANVHSEEITRSFPIVDAANLKFEEQFMQKVAALLLDTEPVWSLLPDDSYTMHMRATGFQLITKSAAAVYQLYAVPHENFPICLWQLWDSPQLAQDCLDVPDCLKDPFTLQMQAAFPTFSGPEFFALLNANMPAYVEILLSGVSRHGSWD